MNPTLLALPVSELKALLSAWKNRDTIASDSKIVRQLLHLEKCDWDKTWAALSWEQEP